MRCVIAGGGTGGHLFPGIAIAEAFVERERENEVLFIGTERGIEAKVLPGSRFSVKMIQAKPFKGRSLIEKWRALWSLPRATSEAVRILKDFRPQVVVGVGGYASGPALIAAFLLGIKRAVHEQNVVPGMTNRFLKWFSHRVFLTFEETGKYFPKGKTFVTGNPIRKQFLDSLEQREKLKKEKGVPFTLFVFGGSAGAHRINQAMIDALDFLGEMKSSMKLIHQTGAKDFEFVREAYERKGFDARVGPFFEDMATYYQISDLVISRAGAGTLSELAVCQKAVVFVPYPYAAHNHQVLNAQRLVDLGAARMIRDEALDGRSLSQVILDLYHHPEERLKMEKAIGKVSHPEAAQEIVDHCYAMANRLIHSP